MALGRLYGNQNAECLVFLVCMNQQEAEDIGTMLEETKEDFAILPCIPFSWENDLTPYEASNPFKKGSMFSGWADCFLKEILVVTESLPAKRRILAGYSLAGLFALYAGTRCSAFDGLVAGSPSLWYPDFVGYAQTHPLNPSVRHVYLSIGDLESKTKNPTFQTIDQKIGEYCGMLESSRISFCFERNHGKHVDRVKERMARGIREALLFR